MRNLMMTLNELKETISKKVVGQPQLIESLLVTLQLQDLKLTARHSGLKTDIMSNLLIVGNTGTGKTMAVREAVKAFKFKLIELNAKTFSQEGGWAGESFSTQINQVLTHDHSDELVIFIDEIDKVIRPQYESGGSDVNHSIQEGLLKFIEGGKTTRDSKGVGGYSLANACFIFAGAFTGMLNKPTTSSIGFFSGNKQLQDPETIQQKLIKFGMMEELVGRINRVAVTNNMTLEMFRAILANEYNTYNQYLEMLKITGIKPVDYEPQVAKLIEKALQSNLGARGLNQLFMEEIDKLIKLQFMDEAFINKLGPYNTRRMT